MKLNPVIIEYILRFKPYVQFVADNEERMTAAMKKDLYHIEALGWKFTLQRVDSGFFLWDVGAAIQYRLVNPYSPITVHHENVYNISGNPENGVFHAPEPMMKYLSKELWLAYPHNEAEYFQKSTVSDLYDIEDLSFIDEYVEILKNVKGQVSFVNTSPNFDGERWSDDVVRAMVEHLNEILLQEEGK